MPTDKNNWAEIGKEYYVRSVAQNIEELPVGVYTIRVNPMNKELYLEFLKSSFEFPFKVYGIERPFVDRVTKTFRALDSNLGVLLNGMKGTGKTVTAEMICNNLSLPVILVTEDLPGLVPFMNEFTQDVIFFLDEYEKVFRGERRDDGSHKLLSIMDGCLNTAYRKVFLLTTNNLHVDDNLIQRPGRIRYKKSFGNLEPNVVLEIIDDKLEKPEHRQALFDLISQLEIVTVDIVSSLITEVNIHNEAPDTFFGVFNLEKMDTKKDVYIVNIDNNTGAIQEKLVGLGLVVEPVRLEQAYVGQDVYVNGNEIGEVHEILGNGQVVIKSWVYNNTNNIKETPEPVNTPTSNPANDPFEEPEKRFSRAVKLTTWRFADVPTYRGSMRKFLV
jgi:hypothetical protein